jgi:hypothetical protein
VRALVASTVLFFALTTIVARAAPTPAPEPEPTMNAQELNQRLKEAIEHHSALPTPLLPSKPEHVEFVVETNKKGQVARVRSGKESQDAMFNAMTYGNALQTFIRTEDGRAIAGTYRLSYDYSPDTKNVQRSVDLIQAGGVNPDAIGAVDDMAKINAHKEMEDYAAWKAAIAKEHAAKPHASPTPSPART